MAARQQTRRQNSPHQWKLLLVVTIFLLVFSLFNNSLRVTVVVTEVDASKEQVMVEPSKTDTATASPDAKTCILLLKKRARA